MTKIEKYSPLEKIIGFYIEEQEDKKYLIWDKYRIPVGPKGIIPKSGLCFYDILKNKAKGKTVLDLGCGEMGIISLFAIYAGAKSVTAVDIDKGCVEWVNYIKSIYKIDNLDIRTSNMFEKIKQKYDIIISNPPIMPMSKITKKNVHDSGGSDGRLFLTKIIKNSVNFLNDGGCIYLSAFSFLGTDTKTNDAVSLQEYALTRGYSSLKVIKSFKKIISVNSVTYKQIPYIKTIYPHAKIDNFNGKYCVKFQILEIKK